MVGGPFSRLILAAAARPHRTLGWQRRLGQVWLHEQGKGDLGKDEFRATVHDPSQPPLTTYAELLRVMAENGVRSVSLDQAGATDVLEYRRDFDEKTLFAPQGATRVDIALPTELQLDPQTHEHDASHHRRNPYPTHYFVGISSLKGARSGSAAFGGGLRIEFKIDTNIEHERDHLEEGRIFVNFGPGVEQGLPRFGVLMYVNIPGMD